MIFVKYNNIHESTEGVVDHGNGESDSTQPPVLADWKAKYFRSLGNWLISLGALQGDRIQD